MDAISRKAAVGMTVVRGHPHGLEGLESRAAAVTDELSREIERETATTLERVDQRLEALASGDDRPQITIRQELVALTDEALASLQTQHNLFVRARMIVQLGRADGLEDPETRLIRPVGAPVILQVGKAAILDRLGRAARWVRRARNGDIVTARPPSWVAEQIIGRTGWRLPPLEGVVTTPVLRPDGTVLSVPGYDRATGLFFEPAGDFPPIPDRPTRAEAEGAARVLLEPVQDFPFTDASGRSAYLAAVLSLVGRHAIDGSVPGFAISSPTPGTGKGLLANVIALVSTGRTAAVMTQSFETEELRKRVLALALAGTALVLVDNLSGVLGSDALAAALTTTIWSDRILGVSQVVEVPLRVVWLFTGNNLAFRRTLGRRMVPIYLDAGIEHPEDRQKFTFPDLIGWIEARRRALVAAALTLLRAYFIAGRPRHGAPRMGSFESWDDLIRGACVWVDLADPAATNDSRVSRGRIRAELDQDLEALGILLAALADRFGDRAFRTEDVVHSAETHSLLRTGLETVGAPDRKGQITAARIGYCFRTVRDRVLGGRKLVKEGIDGHAKTGLWRVATSAVAGDAGNAGNVSGLPETSPASPASPADVGQGPDIQCTRGVF